MINAENLPFLAQLREELLKTHRASSGSTDDLVGCNSPIPAATPNQQLDKSEPIILYHHRCWTAGLGCHPITRADGHKIDDLIGEFARAAAQAQQIGFQFVT